MLFVVNAIRAFAFSWAELPNIIRVGLENAHGSPSAGRDDDLDEERLADAGEGLDHEEENIFAPTKKGHVEAVEGDEDEDEALPVAASPRNDEAKDVSGQTVMFERSLSLASVAGLLLVSATVAIILQEPTFTVGPLFDMCFWAGSKTATARSVVGSSLCFSFVVDSNTVIDAVRFNAGKMIQTFLLGLLVMYVWSIMGIWWLSDFHSEDNCNNMLQCFFSYFYFAYVSSNPFC
ncbi:hypothetical protein T484DRAFT_1784346 [Baffinella frigidus]|nr:hypothetical protein T484DRAFT_1784346 [Cryptophyta sp. CCMP2293]